MKKLIAFIFILFFTISLNAVERGIKITKSLDQNAVIGKQYLVLIGINKYRQWPSLKGPMKDINALKSILTAQYEIDKVIELYDENATKANIIKLFKQMQTDVNIHDSIMIFYAGHGHLDTASNTGFWIPCDAGNDENIQENWLPNTQIRGFLSNIKSRHILLISDSCFSGDILNLTRSKAPEITNEYFRNAYARISRQVLSSGASETVSDDSTYTQQLKLALEGNTIPYIDPLMLYNDIRLGIKGQTPMLGNLKDSGHQDGGSFLLFLKDDYLVKLEAYKKALEQEKFEK